VGGEEGIGGGDRRLLKAATAAWAGVGPAWGCRMEEGKGGAWYDAAQRREGASSRRQDPGAAAPGRARCGRRLDRGGRLGLTDGPWHSAGWGSVGGSG
jgi:hypothetical protein